MRWKPFYSLKKIYYFSIKRQIPHYSILRLKKVFMVQSTLLFSKTSFNINVQKLKTIYSNIIIFIITFALFLFIFEFH